MPYHDQVVMERQYLFTLKERFFCSNTEMIDIDKRILETSIEIGEAAGFRSGWAAINAFFGCLSSRLLTG